MKPRHNEPMSPVLALGQPKNAIATAGATDAAESDARTETSTQGRGGSPGATPGGSAGGLIAPRKLLVGDWCSEGVIAEALGLSREVVAEERDGLREGTDWRLAAGHIELSEAGVWNVLTGLGLAKKTRAGRVLAEGIAFEPIAEKTAAPASAVVHASFVRVINIHTIEVDYAGERRRIGVRETGNFLPKMPVPVRDINGQWVFAGRLPRWRGRY